jgi:hypothetical protein
MARKTYRRKSHKRHTRKRGGSGCPCSGAKMFGGRGYTTGASQELYQMTGRTPGLSSGGNRRRNRSRRNRN